MKRTACALLLLVFFSATTRSSEPISVRVLTYNIHHGEGTDGRFDLPRLAALISAASPDLVALQEVDQRTARADGVDQLAELERLTGMHGQFGKAMDFQGGAYGVAVLTRQPVVRAVNRALPERADREPRTQLTVDVRMNPDGPLVHFTSTHLDQGREPEHRLEQASFLNDLLTTRGDMPGILAGDMNSRPDTEVMQLLAGRWFAPFPQLSPVAPDRPRGLVDHVLARPAEDWRALETQVIDDRLASDHRPLLVVLEWSPTATN
ncbi:MAG: endonuclease/exonuclease/phosphatase family protein [Vicinamibacterales bacterium]